MEQHADKTRQWLSKFAKKHVGDSVERLQKALQVSSKSKQKFEEQVIQRQKAVEGLRDSLNYYNEQALVGGKAFDDAHDFLVGEIYQDMKNLQVNSKELNDLLKLRKGLAPWLRIVTEFREGELKKAQKRLQDQQQTSAMIERELAKQ